MLLQWQEIPECQGFLFKGKNDQTGCSIFINDGGLQISCHSVWSEWRLFESYWMFGHAELMGRNLKNSYKILTKNELSLKDISSEKICFINFIIFGLLNLVLKLRRYVE